MFDIILERIRQKHRTHPYPKFPVIAPKRLRANPKLKLDQCLKDCRICLDLCPSESLSKNEEGKLKLDLGSCLFCPLCETSCPQNVFEFTSNYSLATSDRKALILSETSSEIQLASSLNKEILKLFGRSLKLREVSAGGCNGCEVDTNVLNTLFFDLGRFGIQFVASPRHADGLLITGPISKNMELALKKTYDAIPSPKIVIAVGACAISGGLFRENPEVYKGTDSYPIPVDLFIPGCPPHPMTILDGLLRLLNKLAKIQNIH